MCWFWRKDMTSKLLYSIFQDSPNQVTQISSYSTKWFGHSYLLYMTLTKTTEQKVIYILLDTCGEIFRLDLYDKPFSFLHQINFSHWTFDKMITKQNYIQLVSFFYFYHDNYFSSSWQVTQKDKKSAVGFWKWGQISI